MARWAESIFLGEPFVQLNNMTTLLLRPIFYPEEMVDSQSLWYVEDPFDTNYLIRL